MGKRDEITLQTKQNFIDAFWSLYCEKRIEKITVKDITNRAGYNRSTFYEYFSDAYDVLEYLEQSLIPTIEKLPPVNTPSGDFGMPMDMFMNLYEQNAKYYSVLLGEKGDPAFASKLKNTVKPILMGELTHNTSIDNTRIDYVLEYILTAMIGMMSYWFSQKNPIPKEELYDLIKKLMEEGVLEQLMN